MLVAAKKAWVKRLALAAFAAVAVGTAALPSQPAEGQVLVGVGPYYAPGYYRPFFYPRPVAFRACGWGWHWVPPHWTRWGRWVPGGCRPNW